jgi:hypothetical protein
MKTEIMGWADNTVLSLEEEDGTVMVAIEPKDGQARLFLDETGQKRLLEFLFKSLPLEVLVKQLSDRFSKDFVKGPSVVIPLYAEPEVEMGPHFED